jgi:hypothetical protein
VAPISNRTILITSNPFRSMSTSSLRARRSRVGHETTSSEALLFAEDFEQLPIDLFFAPGLAAGTPPTAQPRDDGRMSRRPPRIGGDGV